MDKNEKLKALLEEGEALTALIDGQADGATEEQTEKLETLASDKDTLKSSIVADEKVAKAKATFADGRKFLESSPGPKSRPGSNLPDRSTIEQVAHAIPATAKRYGRLKSFHGPDAELQAHRFGMFCMGAIGRPRAQEWCAANGIDLIWSGHTEGSNTAGGFLTPTEFDNAMIVLIEQYGVARQFCRIVPMGSDTKNRLRREGGLTAYAIGETGAITQSTKKWGNVGLVAKDWGVITTISNDLNEDAAINIGDDLAGEIARAFAVKEDDTCFNGDATSTYHGITGLRTKLLGLSSTRADISGLIVGAGNAWSELTLGNFESVVGLLPSFGDTPATRWFVHRKFWHQVMAPLLRAAGGNTASDLQAAQGPQFLGYDVQFVTAMPKVEANDVIPALLGDLSLAVDFGDRRQSTISFSDSAVVDSVSMFQTNQLALRGTERFDVNVHDVGNATSTAANKVEGPIVGLLTAAS